MASGLGFEQSITPYIELCQGLCNSHHCRVLGTALGFHSMATRRGVCAVSAEAARGRQGGWVAWCSGSRPAEGKRPSRNSQPPVRPHQ